MNRHFYSIIIILITIFFSSSLSKANNKWQFKKNDNKDYYLTNDQDFIIFQNNNKLFIETWGYSNITNIKISPYNNYLAVSTNLGLALYNLNTKKLIKYFITKSKVNSIDFHPNGKTIILGLENGQTILWNVQNFSYNYFIQELNPVKIVKFTPNGKSIIFVTSGIIDNITKRNMDTKIIYTLNHKNKIRDISVTNNSIYFGDESGSVYHINTESRKTKKILSHNGWVNSITHTNNLIISGGLNNTIYIHSLFKDSKTLYFSNSPVKKLIVHNNTLYSAYPSGIVSTTNLYTKKEKVLIKTKHGIKNMALSKDANIMVITLSNNKLLIISLLSEVIHLIDRHLASIYSVSSINKDSLVITGHDDGTVAFWIRKKRLTVIRKEHSVWVNDIFIINKTAFSGDGSGRVIEWDLNLFIKKRDIFFNKPILGFTPKSKNNIRVITPNTIYKLNTISKNAVPSKNFDHRIIAFKFNKQDKQLAIALSNGDIVILDSDDKIIKRINNKKPISTIKWGLEKDQLYLTHKDGTNVLLSLKKPYKKKLVKKIPSGIINFGNKDKSTSLIWAKRGGILKVKTKDNKVPKVKSIGEKDKRDVIRKLKKIVNNKSLAIKDIAKAHLMLAEIYYSQGEYNSSLYHYDKALSLYKKLNALDYLWKIYNNMGVIYYNQKLYKKGVNIFIKALNLKENHPIILYNTALAYRALKNANNTYLFFNKALNSAKSNKNMLALGHVSYIFAKYYYKQKKYKLANSYITTCLSAAKAINHVGLTKKSILFMAKLKDISKD